jgi:hypothetical protein
MDPTTGAIGLTEARWEAWIGALQRLQHAQALLAIAGAPKRRAAAARRGPPARRSLLWMLAVSACGLLLL